MARIRSIKPSTWTDRHFVACSPLARLLWIGAWNFADDYGVLKDDPVELRYQILPADDCDPHKLVDELVSRRMLLRKIAPDGTNVLVIRTFCVHQKIDTRSPGRWGKPEDFKDANRALEAVQEQCTPLDQEECTPPDHSPPFPTDPDPGVEGIGPSLLVNPAGSTDPYAESFAEVWAVYPRKRGRQEALRAYQARRRSGVSHVQLLTAARNYARTVEGKEQDFIMYGKRFFGPHSVWIDYLTTPSTERVVVER